MALPKPYLTVSSPLDKNDDSKKFELVHITGEEGICRDFSYTLTLTTPERLTDPELEQLNGDEMTVRISFPKDFLKTHHRYINGVVVQIEEVEQIRLRAGHQFVWVYKITLGSWFGLLDRFRDCRIIQKQVYDAVRIIRMLLIEYMGNDLWFDDTKIRPMRKRPYKVMYNETPYNFICRLLQEEGLHWYFRHTKKQHILVFCEPDGAHEKVLEIDTIQDNSIESFGFAVKHQPVRHILGRNFDYEQPPAQNLKVRVDHTKGLYQHFEYPAPHDNREELTHTLYQRGVAMNNDGQVYHGKSALRNLCPGYLFTLDKKDRPELQGKEFLIRSVKLIAGQTQFENQFEATPKDQVYRRYPEEGIVKPKIMGTQTAIVVGRENSSNVTTDEQGRVRVRFHWDHHGPEFDLVPSAWVRVAMPAAGNNRGFLFTPNIGEEVMVMFEDGDPEKPIVVGSVYNNSHLPPLRRDNRFYQSTIKSHTDRDANQIVFDDRPGSEDFVIRAKKDMNINVKGKMKIDVTKGLTINAKSIRVNSKTDITNTAGGSIVSMALISENSLAGGILTNTAAGLVANTAAGAVLSTAGGLLTNTSVFGIANTSAANIENNASATIINASGLAVANMAPNIENNADLVLANKSGVVIANMADKKIENSALVENNKIDLLSKTETKTMEIKGAMVKEN